MKKWLLFLVLVPALSRADVSQKLNIATQDGTVNTYPYQARFTNGSLTDNLDGTVSVSIVAGPALSSTNVWTGGNTFQSSTTFRAIVTVVSSMSVTSNGTANIPAGLLDVYKGAPISAGQPLFSVGSINQNSQFVLNDQSRVDMSRYGALTGALSLGDNSANAGYQSIWDANTNQQKINFWNAGEMDIQTGTTANGGGNIVLLPNTISEVVVSSLSVTISTRTIFNGPTISTGSTPGVSACGATPNGAVAGTDQLGVISVGGGVVTSCVFTPQNPCLNNNLVCVITDNSTTVNASVTAQSKSANTFSTSATLGGGLIFYTCGCPKG
jgi:hypothetical protein